MATERQKSIELKSGFFVCLWVFQGTHFRCWHLTMEQKEQIELPATTHTQSEPDLAVVQLPLLQALHAATERPMILMLAFATWHVWIAANFHLSSSTAAAGWGTALLMALFVGTALNANAFIPPWRAFVSQRRWSIARFYLIPFCVSSYSTIAAEHGFIALFPVSDWVTGVVGLAVTAAVVLCLIATRIILTLHFRRRASPS